MRQGRGPQRERGNGGDHSRDKGQERTRKQYPAAHRRSWARTWVKFGSWTSTTVMLGLLSWAHQHSRVVSCVSV